MFVTSSDNRCGRVWFGSAAGGGVGGGAVGSGCGIRGG